MKRQLQDLELSGRRPLGRLTAVLNSVMWVVRYGWRRFSSQRHTRASFFTVLFSVMGHIAKTDGRVSEKEIAYSQRVMTLMGLSERRRRKAIELFTRGKQADFNLDAALVDFRRDCHGSQGLIHLFLEVLLRLAYADGDLHAQERQRILHTFNILGFSEREFEHMAAEAEASTHFRHERREQEEPRQARSEQARAQARSGEWRSAYRDQQARAEYAREQARASASGAWSAGGIHGMLRPAYALLGIAPTVSDDEVKRAYRRQMSQHHPDKLAASGASEEMLRLATERTQEIKAAYERIRAARKLR